MAKYINKSNNIYSSSSGKSVCTVWSVRPDPEDRNEGESWLDMRRRTDGERDAIKKETIELANDICQFLNERKPTK